MNEQGPNKTPDQVPEKSPLSENESLVEGQFLLPNSGNKEEPKSIEPRPDPTPIQKSVDSPILRSAQRYSDASSAIASGILIGILMLIGGGFFGCIGGQTLRIFPKLPEGMVMLLLALIFVGIPGYSIFLSIQAVDKGSSPWSSKYTGQFALLFLMTVLLCSCFVQNLFTARSL